MNSVNSLKCLNVSDNPLSGVDIEGEEVVVVDEDCFGVYNSSIFGLKPI